MANPVFQYSAQFLVSIERTISKERLSRYLAATQGDTVKALELYEYNVALSFPFAVQKVQKLNSQGGLSFESTVL